MQLRNVSMIIPANQNQNGQSGSQGGMYGNEMYCNMKDFRDNKGEEYSNYNFRAGSNNEVRSSIHRRVICTYIFIY